jgi:ADP-heptose:LPS heptosyltransferase
MNCSAYLKTPVRLMVPSSPSSQYSRQASASWVSIAMLLAWKGAHRLLKRPPARATYVKRHVVLFAAFKGMGDLLCAAPVIKSELNAGSEVILLLFPQLGSFVELIDFGPNRNHLRTFIAPVTGAARSVREFLRQMSALAPDLLWYSPHAPRTVSSWKIPLLLWITKRRYWPSATLAGAESERLSWLFDVRVPIDRSLPYRVREWTAYSMLGGKGSQAEPPAIAFKDPLQRARLMPRAYDLLIHPGAGAENRKWPCRRYAEMLNYIPSGCRIAVMGLPQDIAAMKAALPGNRDIEFRSGSLDDAITSIARTRVALTMDSGTMFFANILGVPTVTLFGPSDPATVIRAGANVVQVYDVKWPCQPCSSTRCSQKSVYCMDSIEPERVAKEVLRLLEREC